MTYDEFFTAVVGGGVGGDGAGPSPRSPYEYQRQLAAGDWPDMLDIPTGLGKTAAITIAWLYRRLTGDDATPRRLVWCLPMRVLVEQTRDAVGGWLAGAAPLFEECDEVVPQAYVLMGGEVDAAWVHRPEHPSVLIGTQDMLLSRALMRGYGASRYRWPIDFALLHNDALWLFDEVQLMGAGLPTSAQLEAFRRRDDMPVAVPSRTIWSSATMRTDWFRTVDFGPYAASARALTLPEADRRDARVSMRFDAPKRLIAARSSPAGTKKADLKAYLDALGDEVVAAHTGDAPTLVIMNSVGRAQELFRRVRHRLADDGRLTSSLLVHSRFRSADRAALNDRIRELRPDDDAIVVATQAVEAGVDISSRNLFTELAPWPSLVQRFGRCNRGGEHGGPGGIVHWIDLATDASADLALPYGREALDRARELLRGLDSASPSALPPVDEPYDTPHVLRRKDFLELFNTEPDLSGFDIDISPYLRDTGDADVQLFWRNASRQAEQRRPGRDELCPAPIGLARAHLKTVRQRPLVWNTLQGEWAHVDLSEIRPGQLLMLDTGAGGYDTDLGFVSGQRGRVDPVGPPGVEEEPADAMDRDPGAAGEFVELAAHLLAARREAAQLAASLPTVGAGTEVVEAALWHDVGKAHPAFQTALLEHAGAGVDRSCLWAKSPDVGRRLHYGVEVEGELHARRYFRHEVASMLAWLEAGAGGAASVSEEALGGGEGGEAGELDDAAQDLLRDSDLVAYLLAAHHGKVRLVLRALPGETEPPDGRLYARGVWAGDTLPPVSVNGLRVPPVTLRLDLMQLGHGPMGASWSARTAALLERWGPFRLAWLETMVRLADWRASAEGATAR